MTNHLLQHSSLLHRRRYIRSRHAKMPHMGRQMLPPGGLSDLGEITASCLAHRAPTIDVVSALAPAEWWWWTSSAVSLASRTPDISSSLAPSGLRSRWRMKPLMLAWYVAVVITSAPLRRKLMNNRQMNEWLYEMSEWMNGNRVMRYSMYKWLVALVYRSKVHFGFNYNFTSEHFFLINIFDWPAMSVSYDLGVCMQKPCAPQRISLGVGSRKVIINWMNGWELGSGRLKWDCRHF